MIATPGGHLVILPLYTQFTPCIWGGSTGDSEGKKAGESSVKLRSSMYFGQNCRNCQQYSWYTAEVCGSSSFQKTPCQEWASMLLACQLGYHFWTASFKPMESPVFHPNLLADEYLTRVAGTQQPGGWLRMTCHRGSHAHGLQPTKIVFLSVRSAVR